MKKLSNIPSWIPNWRDEAEYPDKMASDEVWAWEFLRRNDQYQKTWIEKIVPCFDRGNFNFEKFNDANQNRGKEVLNDLAKEFGVHHLQPSSNQIPPMFKGPVKIFYKVDEIIDFNKEIIKERNEILVPFNLETPLSPQIKFAKKILIDIIRARKENQTLEVKNHGIHKRKLVVYLRLLDAKKSGAKTKEIAKVLYPKLSADYDSPVALRMVKDDWEAALNLTKNVKHFFKNPEPRQKNPKYIPKDSAAKIDKLKGK